MAVDEAILRAVATREAPPTLRFFAWEPPALSLGRGQRASDVDEPALREAGYGLVRRPTGGKAILHADELTYSVIAPQEDPRVSGPVGESYRRLSSGLVRGLAYLGVVEPQVERKHTGARFSGPVCFEVPSEYEITFLGRKLVGSAQMRSEGVVLQHGAVPLCGDIARICAVLVRSPEPRRVRARATTVEEALGRAVTWDQAAEAMAHGFSEALKLHMKPGTLSPAEQTRASELRRTKYAHNAWTYRV